jgi:glycosyltransferase involved in cell wall biosynthesis
MSRPGTAASPLAALPRVLHLLAPGPFGGLESVVTALARGWAEQGGSVGVALAVEPGHPAQDDWVELEAAGVRVLRLRVAHRAYYREWRSYAGAMQEFAPDVVHCHGYRPDVLAGWAARGRGLPRVSTVHGFTGGGWKNRFYERLQLRALRRFEGVIAVSRPIRDRLVRIGIPERSITVIPNALRPTDLLPRAEARRRLGLSGTGPVLAWVGRMSREKGLDVLIGALATLRDLPVTLSVLGEGPLRRDLEEQAARLGVTDRLHWHGTVSGAARYFPAFDGFILSSRTEGTPIALLEAMAAGVPVVATRVGGVPDILAENEAFLVDSEDSAGLSAAIRRLLADPRAASQQGQRAKARVARDFSMEVWIHRHAHFYREILARSPETL